MNEDLDAGDAVHPHEAVESDVRLLVLARFDDRAATTELWNRYYAAAWRAARARDPKHPGRLVAATFRREMAQAEKQNTRISLFLTDWFQGVGAGEPPSAGQKAVAWAFYAMDESSRTLVWRHQVDGWPPARLAQELDTDPARIDQMIAEAEEQFRDHLVRAGAALELETDPAAMDRPDWAKAALTAALLGASPETTGPGLASNRPDIDSRWIIAPPPPPQAHGDGLSGFFQGIGQGLGRAGAWWTRLKLPVRIVALVVLIAAVLGGGTVAWAHWQGVALPWSPAPTGSSTPAPSHSPSGRPTPSPRSTPTPSDTPSPTPTPSASPTPTPTPTAEQPVQPTPPSSRPTVRPTNRPTSPAPPTKDYCPGGDYSGNPKDGSCGVQPAADDSCPDGDYSGSTTDGTCGTPPVTEPPPTTSGPTQTPPTSPSAPGPDNGATDEASATGA